MRFRPHVLSRRTHKWLALIVGVQAVIWTLSGLYMTVVHIDTIHGDHFIRQQAPKPLAATSLISPARVAAAAGAEAVRLATHLDLPVYIARSNSGELMFDARTGERIAPPSKEQIARLAQQRFS